MRVFSDILSSNLIEPKLKKSDIEELDKTELKQIAQEIINLSINQYVQPENNDYSINEVLKNYELNTFNVCDDIKILLDNKIEYSKFISLIDDNAPTNLRWLKYISTNKDLDDIQNTYSIKYPVKKVLLVEGITEGILLPKFATILNYDFDKNGICIMSAGGKNQVVKLYYELIEELKIPVFVLLDKDAVENFEQIKKRLRDTDKIHILKCGEFEDLLPIPLLERTLDYELNNISLLDKNILLSDEPKVKILEEIFKTRGRHEFKKADFAHCVYKNICDISDVSEEIKQIFKEIR